MVLTTFYRLVKKRNILTMKLKILMDCRCGYEVSISNITKRQCPYCGKSTYPSKYFIRSLYDHESRVTYEIKIKSGM